jgi:LmbE family N-acetylglucosaminyl deacetylase
VAAHPGAAVITVTAGRPGPHQLTRWEQKSGFAQGDDVVGRRRQEDEAALKELGARPVWLDFLDSQYAGPPPRRDIANAIEKVIRGNDCEIVASPLGLWHSDHVMTAAASLEVARRMPGLRWYVYEDAIYRAEPGETAQALSRMRDDGLALGKAIADVPGAGDHKLAAITCYSTQLKALGERWLDALEPERYWKLGART